MATKAHVVNQQSVTAGVRKNTGIAVKVADQINVAPYSGVTHITPNTDTQIFYTEKKLVGANIVVDPIPSDWGHITWNGSVLTVS